MFSEVFVDETAAKLASVVLLTVGTVVVVWIIARFEIGASRK
jgi:hypothetical protein